MKFHKSDDVDIPSFMMRCIWILRKSSIKYHTDYWIPSSSHGEYKMKQSDVVDCEKLFHKRKQ